jgi:putative glutamine amidotransferase
VSAGPLIATVAHRRAIDTVLGEQQGAIAYGGYLEHLHRAGAEVVVLAPGTRVPAVVRDNLRGLLLTGGGDVAADRFGGADADARDVDLARDAMELDLVRHCRAERIPVLGMCRGNQVLNVALGGTLRTVEGHVQDAPLSETTGTVRLDPGCRLRDVLGAPDVAVNSYHRWAIGEPAPGMAVTARATDEVPEGIEWVGDDWFAIGTQWHAELLDAAHVPSLFRAFVAAAREEAPA